MWGIDFGPDYHPRLIGQRIKAASLRRLRPDSQTREQIMEVVLVEHYIALLPFQPKSWVLCHKPVPLEKTIGLIEAMLQPRLGCI